MLIRRFTTNGSNVGPSLPYKSGFVCPHTSTEATQKLFPGQITQVQVLHFPSSCERCARCCSRVSQEVLDSYSTGILHRSCRFWFRGSGVGAEILHFSHAPWQYHCCWPEDHTSSSEILCHWGKYSSGFLRTVLVLALKVRGKSQ